MDVPFFFLLLAFAVFVSFFFRVRRTLPYPPGPKGFPIIGNILLMEKLTHRGLAGLAKTYGGLLHLRMGKVHFVAISSPAMAREALQVNDAVFANRPANDAVVYLTYNRADMAFANYGAFWRQIRKICVMKVFSRKRVGSWASVRNEVDSVVRVILSELGSPVKIGELVFALTRNITYKSAFGSDSRDGQDEFVKILQEFSFLFGAFSISEFLPWMRWIEDQRFNNRLVKARESLDGFIDKIIDDHIEKKNGGNYGDGENEDMVDELLAYYSEDSGAGACEAVGDDIPTGVKLTKDNIKAVIMDVMFGGTETVASAIEWAMAELMTNPDEMKKVQDELTAVVGLDRKLHESDLENLPYFKSAIKETLRLHPPIPVLLHETSQACVVAGYSIPAQTRVMINAWAIGRDESAWENPDEFKPSRFLKDGAPDFKGSDYEFIPFGSGRRSCPGMQLGLYAMELAVGNLVHCFTWELPDGMKPGQLNMDDKFGLTAPKASPLVAIPSDRLSCSI